MGHLFLLCLAVAERCNQIRSSFPRSIPSRITLQPRPAQLAPALEGGHTRHAFYLRIYLLPFFLPAVAAADTVSRWLGSLGCCRCSQQTRRGGRLRLLAALCKQQVPLGVAAAPPCPRGWALSTPRGPGGLWLASMWPPPSASLADPWRERACWLDVSSCATQLGGPQNKGQTTVQ